jgi:hypothetical protein
MAKSGKYSKEIGAAQAVYRHGLVDENPANAEREQRIHTKNEVQQACNLLASTRKEKIHK